MIPDPSRLPGATGPVAEFQLNKGSGAGLEKERGALQ